MRLINYFIYPSVSLMLIMGDYDVFLLSRPTNAQHIYSYILPTSYIYIYIYIYIYPKYSYMFLCIFISSYPHTRNTNTGITPTRQSRLYIQPQSQQIPCTVTITVDTALNVLQTVHVFYHQL